MAMKFMETERLREQIAIEAMKSLLSNSQFYVQVLKILKIKGLVKSDSKFFDVVSSYACKQADSLMKELDRTAEKPSKK